MVNENDFLTPEEIDRLFRYPRGRAVKLARGGMLPAVFLPDGEVRFEREAIAAALRGMTRGPASVAALPGTEGASR